MSKRVLFGGLAAVALALATGDTAQAQHYRGGYGGGFYRPVYPAPIVVAPRPIIYSGINSPYFGFGNAGYPFGRPIYGGGWGGGWNNGWGGWNNGWGGYYGGGSVLNIGISRPGFGISFGTIIR